MSARARFHPTRPPAGCRDRSAASSAPVAAGEGISGEAPTSARNSELPMGAGQAAGNERPVAAATRGALPDDCLLPQRSALVRWRFWFADFSRPILEDDSAALLAASLKALVRVWAVRSACGADPGRARAPGPQAKARVSRHPWAVRSSEAAGAVHRAGWKGASQPCFGLSLSARSTLRPVRA